MTDSPPPAPAVPLDAIDTEWIVERMRADKDRSPPRVYLSAFVVARDGAVLHVSRDLDLTHDEVLGILRARKARACLSVVKG